MSFGSVVDMDMGGRVVSDQTRVDHLSTVALGVSTGAVLNSEWL